MFTYPYYTSKLINDDLSEVAKKLDLIAKNKSKTYKNYLSNIAANILGSYYNNGYYIEKNKDLKVLNI